MFFGQVSHSKLLEPARQHPMIKRIVRSELVRLVFVDTRFFGVACDTCGAGKLVVNQSQTRIPLYGIAPNRNSFFPLPELPERFALLLTRQD